MLVLPEGKRHGDFLHPDFPKNRRGSTLPCGQINGISPHLVIKKKQWMVAIGDRDSIYYPLAI